jgi:predicted transcriptional regulator
MKAINYTLNHWLALTRFLKNPDIAIDNNECERAIKCWVLVRKNSLFAGSDEGAKATAIHLSFIASAKRNGINPVDWYADVLSQRVEEVMSLNPLTVSPRTPVLEAASYMGLKNFRRIPVVEKKALVGMVSVGDINRGLFFERGHAVMDQNRLVQPSGR